MNATADRTSILALAVGIALSGTAHAGVVISQVYGGGGNSGAPLRSDFIELHNNGEQAVDLSGWSVHYASSAGTTWQRTGLSGSIAPGGYYLVKQADGSNTAAAALPAPDATGTIPMSASAGKVALTSTAGTLSGACPSGLVDFVGFGGANCFEGAAPVGALSNSTAAQRLGDGCTDSGDNRTDFAIAAPSPRNRAAAMHACDGATLLNVSDVAIEEGHDGARQLVFTAELTRAAGSGGVRFRYATQDGSALAAEGDYGATTGEAVIPAGETRVQIFVTIHGDTREEADETLQLRLDAVTGAAMGDAAAIGTIVNDDFTIIPIGSIQGDGARSPLEGRVAAARGIVTGRKSNGFFVQSIDIDADTNPATSEGLFVFTRSAPPAAAAVGRRVIVRGAVSEFVPSQDPGQAPLTQLAGEVLVVADGEALYPLPAALRLDSTFPAADGPVDQLERVEGMRVTAPRFTVTAPTGGFTSEREATGSGNGVFHGVVAGVARPFREPGIQAPDAAPGGGAIPPLPRWDFNPELLAVDSDAIGAPALDVAAGTELFGLTGPLDYGFRRYTILPEAAPTAGASPAPRAADAPPAEAFTVAAYNLERFFDDSNDPAVGEPVLSTAGFERRLAKASLGIREALHLPDIVGLVEVESLEVLQRLAERLNADAVAAGRPDPRYVGHLHEGNDVGGIDVGFLVKTASVAEGTPRIAVRAVTQVGKDTQWLQPDGTAATLNDRPPLALDTIVHDADGRAFPVSVVLVHQRSLNGAETDDASGERIRGKRQRQAEFLAAYLDARQDADPDLRLVVLGDFNAFEFNDGLADAMGTVTGRPSTDAQTAVPGDGADLVDPDLVNLGGLEPAQERYSFVFGGNAQALDHVLVNEALVVATRDIALSHARINADFPEVNRSDARSPSRLSDHDPVLAAFVPRRRADLALQASAADASVGAGATFVFEAHLRNDGPEQADRPVIGFSLDAALPALGAIAPAGWRCDAPEVELLATLVTCHAEAMARGGEAVFTLRAPADAALDGRTLRLAAAVEAESLDPVSTNNGASAALDVISNADLGVTIGGPTHPLRGGERAVFRIDLDQRGPHLAAAPVLTLWSTLPVDSADISAPAGWVCPATPDGTVLSITCRVTALAAGMNATFELVLDVPRLQRSEQVTLHARVSAAGTDPDATDDTAAHTMRLVPGGP